jgi:hypothetical protein
MQVYLANTTHALAQLFCWAWEQMLLEINSYKQIVIIVDVKVIVITITVMKFHEGDHYLFKFFRCQLQFLHRRYVCNIDL